jgi:DNA topoisomerase-1
MAISTLSFTEHRQAEHMAATLAASVFLVKEKRVQTVDEAPPLPYTTLTLLEDATLRYGWSGERTMQIAQSLFEGGLITYPRTDSTHTDQIARESAWSLAKERYGIDAVPKAMPTAEDQVGIEGTHEAIRPTEPATLPEQTALSLDEATLYRLIWERFVASQMKAARYWAIEVALEVKENQRG